MRGKAAGSDRLTPDFFKDGGSVLIGWLTDILAKVWELDVTSSELSQSLIVPVYKKGQKFSRDNHREISLTTIVYKILASVIVGCLDEARGHQTRESQAGIRPGRPRGSVAMSIIIKRTYELHKLHESSLLLIESEPMVDCHEDC